MIPYTIGYRGRFPSKYFVPKLRHEIGTNKYLLSTNGKRTRQLKNVVETYDILAYWSHKLTGQF